MASPAQPSPDRARHSVAAVVVFLIAGSLLWLMAGNLFILGLDEGIYFDGGVRVLRGQVPYRDFFALTGPLSYWLEAAAFKLFGVTLAAGRVVMVLDVALLTALVYWLAARLAGKTTALIAAFTFFAFETGLSFRLYANHRWDSSALGMLGVAFAFRGASTTSRRRIILFASGFFAAAAAWCTPSVILLVVAVGLWLIADSKVRSFFPLYALGVVACSFPAIAVLARERALVPMLRSMVWSVRNYSGPNRVYYGYGAFPASSGWRALFGGAWGRTHWLRVLDFFLALIPPLLPVLVYLSWLLRTRKRAAQLDGPKTGILLLLIASAALLLSTYPRWSADELMFVMPVFYVLAAFLLERLAPPRWRAVLGGALAGVAAITLAVSVSGLTREPVIHTRVGTLRAVPQDQQLISQLDAAIPRGSSLFVDPYLPVVYFLTGGVNPTRFDFLEPGMMTAHDTAVVLSELEAHPPQRVVYFEFPAATFFSIWPNARPRKTRLKILDAWLRAHYHLAKVIFHPVAEFAILERNGLTHSQPRNPFRVLHAPTQ